jgi:hypothetical protein
MIQDELLVNGLEITKSLLCRYAPSNTRNS